MAIDRRERLHRLAEPPQVQFLLLQDLAGFRQSQHRRAQLQPLLNGPESRLISGLNQERRRRGGQFRQPEGNGEDVL
jgi:hypothetical protein